MVIVLSSGCRHPSGETPEPFLFPQCSLFPVPPADHHQVMRPGHQTAASRKGGKSNNALTFRTTACTPHSIVTQLGQAVTRACLDLHEGMAPQGQSRSGQALGGIPPPIRGGDAHSLIPSSQHVDGSKEVSNLAPQGSLWLYPVKLYPEQKYELNGYVNW